MKSMCRHVWFDQDTTKVVKHVTCLAQAHQVCKITLSLWAEEASARADGADTCELIEGVAQDPILAVEL